MSEIKACPFCGTEAEAYNGEITPIKLGHWIRCTNNDCECELTVLDKSEAEAITRWNTRAREAELEAKLSIAVEALASIAATNSLTSSVDWELQLPRNPDIASDAIYAINSVGKGPK